MKDTPFTEARLLSLYDRVAEAEDAIPRLRRFVLDLAVRGKLVPQEAGDEPASVLLELIEKEKARLIKAGEIKPQDTKRLSDHTAEKPDGWRIVPLGTIVNRHLGGGTPSKNVSEFWNGNIRWASVKDVGKTKYLDDTQDRITDAGLLNSSSNLIPPGNLIVVTRMGLGQLSINRVEVAINQDLRALFLSSCVALDYVYNFFLTHRMDGTGLTVKGIKLEELLAIPFPLPPLAEQHRIVAKVKELMALLDQLEAARAAREETRTRLTAATLARLTEADTDTPTAARFALQTLPALTTRPDQIRTLRQTILNLAVRGKLVEQNAGDEPALALLEQIARERNVIRKRSATFQPITDDEKGFRTPSGWTWKRFGEVFSIRTGFAFQSSTYTDSGIPVLRVVNFDRAGSFDFSDVKYFPAEKIDQKISQFLLREGEILMVMVGGTIGKTAVVANEILPALLNQNMWRIRSYGELMNGSFEHMLIRFLNQSIENLTNSTHGHFAMSDFEQKVICVPPLAEQRRIVATVEELLSLCDRLERALQDATTTRARLLDATLREALAEAQEAA